MICTVVDRKDCTPTLLWSKTTRTTGGVGGTWEDPPTCEMGTFLLMSLTLTYLAEFEQFPIKWSEIVLRNLF